jgi:hypothetical protein
MSLAITGVVLALLSLIFSGVLSRPLLVAGAGLAGFAIFQGQREARRQVRAFSQQQNLVAWLLGIVAIGLVGTWAGLPIYQRHQVLTQLEVFTTEGRHLQDEMAERVATSNQLMGDQTAKIQDWHARLDTWVATELGIFYRQQLGTPQESPAYPPRLPARLRVFWDKVETDLATLEQFRKEFSGWLFKTR